MISLPAAASDASIIFYNDLYDIGYRTCIRAKREVLDSCLKNGVAGANLEGRNTENVKEVDEGGGTKIAQKRIE